MLYICKVKTKYDNDKKQLLNKTTLKYKSQIISAEFIHRFPKTINKDNLEQLNTKINTF